MLYVQPWRVIVVFAALALSLLFAAPNVLPGSVRDSLPGYLAKGLNLGLDLRGGSQLLLEVDAAALEKERLEQVVDEMAQALAQAKPRIGFTGRGVADGAARLKLISADDLSRAEAVLRELNTAAPGESAPGLDITTSPDGVIEARLSEQQRTARVREAVSESIEVIRRRIDELGTSEVSITRQGADRIVVQAPGESDPEALKRRIGQTAKLTFHLVDMNASPADAATGRAPPGSIVLPQPDNPGEPFVVVKSRALLSGENLTRANAAFDPRDGSPVVSFRFDGYGTREFGRITQQNVNKRFAVVLDGKVITAPNIIEPILGGSGQIQGNFTVDSAEELASLLRAGALPAPLTVIEQRSVTAELGQDAIESGSLAGVIAGVSVLVFMLFAYGLFGVFACVALVANIVMLLGAMSAIGATLTLPGIAGLILTVGMAVDANVLIYERMREEQANGRGAALAIDAGFKRAMATIFDANLTTILAALILFYFGAGPVRGFAWTLSIGVLTSMFTAVLVTQLLVATWFRAVRPKRLPI